MSKSDAARCPNCGEMVEVDIFDEPGDEVICLSCDAELEIVDKDPLRLRIIRRPGSHDEDEFGDTDDFSDEDFG